MLVGRSHLGTMSTGAAPLMVYLNTRNFFGTSVDNGTSWADQTIAQIPVVKWAMKGLVMSGTKTFLAVPDGGYADDGIVEATGNADGASMFWGVWPMPLKDDGTKILWTAVTRNSSSGRYVAISQGAYSAWSDNGQTWTRVDLPSNKNWMDVAWNGTVFCAIAYDGTGTVGHAATSTNGTSWTARTISTQGNWKAICVLGTKFIVIGQGVSKSMTSTDGTTWVEQTMTAGGWNDVCSNTAGTLLVAVNASTSDKCMTSPDGVTWTQRTMDREGNWQSVVHTGTNFIAIASGTGAGNSTSSDGITWTARGLGSGSWGAVAATTSYAFVVSPSDGGAKYSSDQGVTWTSNPALFSNLFLNGIWTGSAFIVLDGSGYTLTGIQTSPDGATWTVRTTPSAREWRGIAHNGSGTIVIISTGSPTTKKAAYSTNGGVSWTTSELPSGISVYDAIAWNGSVFCVVGIGGTIGATSADGITWTQRTLPAYEGNRVGLAWNSSVFCTLVMGTNHALTSPDGITWTQRTLPAVKNWRNLAWNGTVFCAVYTDASTAPTCATSPDGTTWTSRAMGTVVGDNYYFDGITWNGVNFIATGGNDFGKFVTGKSADGIAWSLSIDTALTKAVRVVSKFLTFGTY